MQHLQDWILHPEYLNEDSLEELRSCIVQYPYFQTARLIYLRNLFSLCRVEFDIELAKNAPYIADLSILFYYVRGDLFAIKGYETAEQCGIISSDRTLDLIDRFLSNQSEQSNGKNKLSMVSQEVDYTDMLESMEVEGSDRALLKGHDLIDKFLEGESELSPIIASGNFGKNINVLLTMQRIFPLMMHAILFSALWTVLQGNHSFLKCLLRTILF